MKLADIISEVQFNTYVGMVQVTYSDYAPTKIAELIRALPGVTTVTMAGQDEAANRVTLKVKLITQKPHLQAFDSLKKNALAKYTPIKVVTIGKNTIEKK